MNVHKVVTNINKKKYISTQNEEIDERWNSLKRLYSPEDANELRGSVKIEYSIARQGAEKLFFLSYIFRKNIKLKIYLKL
jgi:isocitrate lyase